MQQGMEPDVKKYLYKVLNSLCYGLLWMGMNVLGGLYWGYAIVNGRITIYNVVFYTWFVLSLAVLLYFLYRIWKH